MLDRVQERGLVRAHRRLPPWGLLLGLTLAVTAQAEVWLGATRPPVVAVAALLGTLPVVVIRRLPLVSFAGAVLALWVLAVDGGAWFPVSTLLALMITTYAAALSSDRGSAWAVLAVAVGSAEAHAALTTFGSPGDFVFPAIMITGPWLAGRAVRSWQERTLVLQELNEALRAEREESARLAVLAERGKIARDLHDTLAQSLLAVVVQAEAAEEALAGEPERSREALHRIQQVGRDSLAQTRQVLGVLRTDATAPDTPLAPQPTLADLDRLCSTVREAGLRVELHADGVPADLPAAVDLSAYRIVQEGLTNVLKHAGASRVVVRLEPRDGGLAIEITDDGHGAAPQTRQTPQTPDGDGASGGYGIVGMRERSLLHGGHLTAGPAPGGGYRVTAYLPSAGGAG